MTDTPTAVVPLAVVPRELVERCLAEVRGNLGTLKWSDTRQTRDRLTALVADLTAALAAAGGREEKDHG